MTGSEPQAQARLHGSGARSTHPFANFLKLR